MPSVKGIYHHKDGVDIDFSVPIAGLSRVDGISRLSIAKNDLTQTKLDQRLAALDLKTDERYGFKVEFVDDPSVPPETLLRVRDRPSPKEPIPVLTPHNTPVFLDGFETRDFALWQELVGGQAEVQSGTVIDGVFSGHFGYSGGPGSDQGNCTSLMYGGAASPVTRVRTYTIFRARITAFAAPSSGHTTILNYRDGSGAVPHLQITEDGKISVSSNVTVYNGSVQLSLDTTYWFGFYLEWDSVNNGWVEGKVWDSDGNLLETVGFRSPTSSENILQASWSHVNVGALFNNTPCEIFIDSVYADDGDDWPPLIKTSQDLYPVDQSATDDEYTTLHPDTGEEKYEDVDDLIAGTADDDTTYIGQTITTTDESKRQGFEHVGHAAGAGIPDGSTVVAVSLWSRFNITGNIGLTVHYSQIRSGSDIQESGQAASGWRWDSPLIRDTHPDGDNWNTKSLADLDAIEIGVRLWNIVAVADSVERTTCTHLLVAYTEGEPPEAAAFVPRVMMF